MGLFALSGPVSSKSVLRRPVVWFGLRVYVGFVACFGFVPIALAQDEVTYSSSTDVIKAQLQLHAVLSPPLTPQGDLWAGFEITAQATWDDLPVSAGLALVVLPFSSASETRRVQIRIDDGPTRVLNAERNDTAVALDPYVQAHLPLDFTFTPYIEASFGPRMTQTRYTLKSTDGEAELELDSKTSFNWEYNLGAGVAWFYDKRERWKGSVVSLAVQYGATVGKSEATVAVGSDEIQYMLPNAALRFMLGWGQRF